MYSYTLSLHPSYLKFIHRISSGRISTITCHPPFFTINLMYMFSRYMFLVCICTFINSPVAYQLIRLISSGRIPHHHINKKNHLSHFKNTSHMLILIFHISRFPALSYLFSIYSYSYLFIYYYYYSLRGGGGEGGGSGT